MTETAKIFIEALLELDPKKRLGANSINEIKNHPFFAGINWSKIKEQKAPFKPSGRDLDTIYFP